MVIKLKPLLIQYGITQIILIICSKLLREYDILKFLISYLLLKLGLVSVRAGYVIGGGCFFRRNTDLIKSIIFNI